MKCANNQCSIAEEELEFYKRPNGRVFKLCKVCYKAKVSNYQKSPSAKIKRNTIKRNGTLKSFGSMPEKYQEMFDAQNGCCQICGKHQDTFDRALAIDHNHQTGEVRGLLCFRCNTKLSVIENKDFREKALSYLDKYDSRC